MDNKTEKSPQPRHFTLKSGASSWENSSYLFSKAPLHFILATDTGITNQIFRQIFYKKVKKIHLHRHVYNLNIELFAGFPDIFPRRFSNFTLQPSPDTSAIK